jgi:hypothetical protein
MRRTALAVEDGTSAPAATLVECGPLNSEVQGPDSSGYTRLATKCHGRFPSRHGVYAFGGPDGVTRTDLGA